MRLTRYCRARRSNRIVAAPGRDARPLADGAIGLEDPRHKLVFRCDSRRATLFERRPQREEGNPAADLDSFRVIRSMAYGSIVQWNFQTRRTTFNDRGIQIQLALLPEIGLKRMQRQNRIRGQDAMFDEERRRRRVLEVAVAGHLARNLDP